MLEEYGLNSDSIKGTGRTNRLLKSDVLAYVQVHSIKKVAPKSGKCDVTLDLKCYLFFRVIILLFIFAVPAPKTDKARSPSPAETFVPPSQPSPYKDIEVSNIRAVIAKRLSEAKV